MCAVSRWDAGGAGGAVEAGRVGAVWGGVGATIESGEATPQKPGAFLAVKRANPSSEFDRFGAGCFARNNAVLASHIVPNHLGVKTARHAASVFGCVNFLEIDKAPFEIGVY